MTSGGYRERSGCNGHLSNGRGTTGDRVYELIRGGIVHGDFQPGERLTEERLAATFGASRTPVRDAIKQLEQDGLVSVEPFRGAVVRAFSEHDLLEIFALRVLLEGYAASQAAQRVSEEEVDALQTIVALQLQAENEVTGSELVSRQVALNQQFHLAIVNGCGNGRLLSIYRNLSDVPIYWKSRYWENDYERVAGLTYHQQLVDAIRQNNGMRADAVMRGHILGAQEYFLQELREQSGSAAAGRTAETR